MDDHEQDPEEQEEPEAAVLPAREAMSLITQGEKRDPEEEAPEAPPEGA